MVLELVKKVLIAPADRHIGSACRMKLELHQGHACVPCLQLDSGRVVPSLVLARPLVLELGPVNRLCEENVLDCIFFFIEVNIGAVKGVVNQMRKDLGDLFLNVALEIRNRGIGNTNLFTEFLRLRLTDDLGSDLATTLFDALGTDVERRVVNACVVVRSAPPGCVGVGFGKEVTAEFLEARLQPGGKIQTVLVGSIIRNAHRHTESHLEHLACVFCLYFGFGGHFERECVCKGLQPHKPQICKKSFYFVSGFGSFFICVFSFLFFFVYNSYLIYLVVGEEDVDGCNLSVELGFVCIDLCNEGGELGLAHTGVIAAAVHHGNKVCIDVNF